MSETNWTGVSLLEKYSLTTRHHSRTSELGKLHVTNRHNPQCGGSCERTSEFGSDVCSRLKSVHCFKPDLVGKKDSRKTEASKMKNNNETYLSS